MFLFYKYLILKINIWNIKYSNYAYIFESDFKINKIINKILIKIEYFIHIIIKNLISANIIEFFIFIFTKKVLCCYFQKIYNILNYIKKVK